MKKNKIDLSIIIPVYNIKDYINETLSSLEEISKKINCEVIIQDSCSTDGTSEVIKKYCKKNKNWSHYIEKDVGQSDAINRGIKKATGEFITWLCGDDKLRKEIIFLFKKKEIKKYDLIYGDVVFFDGINFSPAIGTEDYQYGILNKKRLIIQQPGTLIKKKVWDEVGGLNIKLDYVMDYDLFLRLENKYKKFKRYKLFIAEARIRKDAKTSSPSIRRLLEYYYILLKSHFENFKNFSFRPYIIYTIEFFIKNLEYYFDEKNLLLSFIKKKLINIFWIIADPKEKENIERRFKKLFIQL